MSSVKRSLLTMVVGSLIAGPAWAGSSDLAQSISDLDSQTNDKERMDTHAAARVQLSEIRTWLGEARNAVKEEEEETCRRIFDRVRLQLKLVDRVIELSSLRAQLDKANGMLQAAKAKLEQTQTTLAKKKATLRALKMKEKQS